MRGPLVEPALRLAHETLRLPSEELSSSTRQVRCVVNPVYRMPGPNTQDKRPSFTVEREGFRHICKRSSKGR